MIRFAEAVKSPQPKGRWSNVALYGYAVILVVMAVSQLYAFEDFMPLLDSFGITSSQGQAYILAAVIVISEVFALPFLLKMYVSPLFRMMSMVFMWVVALLWFSISTYVYFSVNAVQDAGFLGGAVTVPFGWWCLVFAAGLIVCAAWSSWSMWPLQNPRRSRAKKRSV